MIETYRPRVVLVDLTAVDMVAPAALIAYQRSLVPTRGSWLLALMWT